jgi:hypothetical protein
MVNKQKCIIIANKQLIQRVRHYEVLPLRALGPAPSVGKLSYAVTKLVKIGGMNIEMIIVVYATFNFEGEKTGTIGE